MKGFCHAIGVNATRSLLLVAVSLVLTACYPTYNWRVLEVADGVAQLAFPARVDTATREVDLAGLNVKFELTSADANDIVFSFGAARLPAGTSSDKAKTVQRLLVDTLVASVGQAAPAAAYDGQVFRVEANAQGRSLAIVARVLIHRDMALRVVASGPPDVLTDEVADEFMRSLKLR